MTIRKTEKFQLFRHTTLPPWENAGLENAGLENAAPDCRGGKRGTGKCRSLKSMESEDFKNLFLTTD